jgi:hypothetical protein
MSTYICMLCTYACMHACTCIVFVKAQVETASLLSPSQLDHYSFKLKLTAYGDEVTSVNKKTYLQLLVVFNRAGTRTTYIHMKTHWPAHR